MPSRLRGFELFRAKGVQSIHEQAVLLPPSERSISSPRNLPIRLLPVHTLAFGPR